MSLFKKKSADIDEQDNQGAAKSRGSLLVLLILLGGLAYLYFFTSLIVPHEAPAPAKSPDAVAEVKQSMPPKQAASPAPQTGTPAASPTAVPAVVKPATPAVPGPPAAKPATPVAPAPPAAKPATPAAPAPSAAKPVTPAAPAPVAGKTAPPAVAPKPAAAAKPAAAPPVTAPSPKEAAVVKKDAAKAEGQKTVKAVEKQTAPAVQKAETKSVKAVAPPAAKTAASKKPQLYTVMVGEFAAGDEAEAVEAKLARLGIKPISRNETRKSRTMNRLYYGAYTDYDVYSAELEKLRKSAKGAFGVEKDGTYFLYAGSFSAKDRVEKEKRDLAAKGFTLQIQQTVLSLATVKLTAGRFSSKQEADKAAAKMKSEGLVVKVVSSGR